MSWKVDALAHAQAAQGTGSASAATAQDNGDIIVTAQKRSERLSAALLSITAASGEQPTLAEPAGDERGDGESKRHRHPDVPEVQQRSEEHTSELQSH